MMPTGLVLADDATGSLECASLLASLRVEVSVVLSLDARRKRGAVVVADTETRHLSPVEAAVRVREWLKQADGAVFKKTDSTLRGNIGAELEAMLEAQGGNRPLVYVPAYPALGRTVQNGMLSVHGVPLAQTDFAADIRKPVETSLVADVLHSRATLIPDAHALAKALPEGGSRILVCDATTDADLADLAGVLAKTDLRPWIASPAGFIRNWTALCEFPATAEAPVPPQARKWLIVCGSRHPQSQRQCDAAQSLGLQVLRTIAETQESPAEVAATLAREAVAHIRRENPDGVLIMGGDTVWAIWQALGVDDLIPSPEVLPGIAACATPDRRLLFVTKAGGFGDDRLVERILEKCGRVR